MKPGLNSLSVWFGLIMVLVLACAALSLLIFPDALSERLYGSKRAFFIVLLFAYCVYRGFRVYTLYKNQKREQE